MKLDQNYVPFFNFYNLQSLAVHQTMHVALVN